MFDKPLDGWPEIVNHNEKHVLETLDAYTEAGQLTCPCRECMMDMIALSLNALPPRYTVSLLTKFYATADEERAYMAEVKAAVDRAVQKVQRQPHH